AKYLSQNAAIVFGIPCHGHARAQSAIERIERIFVAGARNIADGGEPKRGIVDLALQRLSCLSVEIIIEADGMASSIHQFHLLTVLLDGRHLDLIAEAIGQRQRWLEVPSIADVQVVEINRVLIEHRSSDWIQA